MFYQSDYHFSMEDIHKELGENPMKIFEDSFRMIIGTSNTDLNWDNNPYVKINVYEITEEWKPKISPTVHLHKCT